MHRFDALDLLTQTLAIAAVVAFLIAAAVLLRTSGRKAAPVEPSKAPDEVVARSVHPDVDIRERNEDDEVMPLRSGVVPRDGRASLPSLAIEDDIDSDLTRLGAAGNDVAVTLPFIYDGDAELEEPTGAGALILTVGHAQTDPGRKRKRNEDSVLVSEKHHLYVVADGMGGHRGGDVASKLAIETVQRTFDENAFPTADNDTLPRRARELVAAIHRANALVHERAHNDITCQGMGTTLSAARFAPKKQRLYIGHVGDSRVYRARAGRVEQMTSDHTLQGIGFADADASLLSRAIGVNSGVAVDIIIAKPEPGDVYMLCSDGLTKMLTLDFIASVLSTDKDPRVAVRTLVDAANDSGGHDNVTVIVVRVESAGAGMKHRVA